MRRITRNCWGEECRQENDRQQAVREAKEVARAETERDTLRLREEQALAAARAAELLLVAEPCPAQEGPEEISIVDPSPEALAAFLGAPCAAQPEEIVRHEDVPAQVLDAEADALTLSQDAIRRANNASMFDPGTSYASEAAGVYKNLLPLFADKPEYSDQQREYLERRRSDWKRLVEKAYNDQIYRRSQFVPVTIAGPANYPSHKMAKIAERIMRTSAEWHEKLTRFEKNTRKELLRLTPADQIIERYRCGYSEPISSDDPRAVEKLSARLDYLWESHEHMKSLNAWHRAHGTCLGFPDMDDDAARSMDESISRAHSWEKKPISSYTLTNNKANISRLEERLHQAVRIRDMAQADDASAEQEYKGFTVVQNAALQRLQILFDGKPCEATRATLKHNGFHWSPREKAWQRLLNNNAKASLQRIVSVLEASNG